MDEPYFAAEFPNDNPSLHRGTIWMSEAPCGVAEPHFAVEIEVEAVVEEPAAIEVTIPIETVIVAHADAEALEDDDVASIEIVEVLAIETPDEIVPAPVVATAAEACEEAVRDMIDSRDVISEPAPEVASDAYASFVRALSTVARESGAGDAEGIVARALDEDGVAAAWRAILRGESEDFGACGAATLDEWAAAVLARVLSAPSREAQLRRDLRAHGVAAYGMVDA